MENPDDAMARLVAVDRYLDAELKYVLSDPNITMPSKCTDVQEYLQETYTRFSGMKELELDKVVRDHEPCWQIASMFRLAKSNLIENFSVNINSNKLSITVRPHNPARFIQFDILGGAVQPAKSLPN